MAIDTAEKRKSLGFLTNIVPGVTPNASKDSEWRVEVGYSYAGIVPTPPAVSVVFTIGLVATDNVGLHLQHQDVGMRVKHSSVGMNVIGD